MTKGKVYIVGAGPGDPGLITVKALDAVKKSDVILYDELANRSFLDSAKEGAELRYVGKKAACHSLPQEKISAEVLKLAQEGKIVCRLKGGDPFVFGRGGEEAELLAKSGIEYEIIPGVTSAIAVPAYAGIPITQRGMTSGLAIFTGHEDPAREISGLNWKAMVELQSTLVFLMGMKNLSQIATNLIENGMDPATPSAVIHKGTTPEQRSVKGPLSEIAKLAESSGLEAPSIIVIGKVVGMSDLLGWFEKRPLFGKRIAVTRSRAQAGKLSAELASLGAAAVEIPTIKIVPDESGLKALEKLFKKLSSYSWLIFTSANAVELFFERLFKSGMDGRSLGAVKVAVIGPATAEKLREYGIRADLSPREFVAESLLAEMKEGVRGKKILLPRSADARDILPEGLKKAGADVNVVDIYRAETPDLKDIDVGQLISGSDIVTFTSSSTVQNLLRLIGDKPELKNKIKAASIGPITSATLKENGIEPVCEASEYTIPGLVQAIKEYCIKK